MIQRRTLYFCIWYLKKNVQRNNNLTDAYFVLSACTNRNCFWEQSRNSFLWFQNNYFSNLFLLLTLIYFSIILLLFSSCCQFPLFSPVKLSIDPKKNIVRLLLILKEKCPEELQFDWCIFCSKCLHQPQLFLRAE